MTSGITVNSNTKVLQVEDLSVTFTQYDRGFDQKRLKVISDLSLSIHEGEILAVIGSSGSGKSLLAHAVLGILPENARLEGKIEFFGQPLTHEAKRKQRGSRIALIPQSVNYLDPLMKVSEQVRTSVRWGDPRKRQQEVFKRYKLEDAAEKLYPFQLSGGMARRVLASTAVVSGAKLIIADEPTPGLHPEVVKETLSHLRELADEGCAVMLITHDINAALTVADNIAVFYAGTTVETAPVSDFSGKGERLRHPYTRALWRALPQNEFIPIQGFQPSPDSLPDGCLFEPRCSMKREQCSCIKPQMKEIRGGRVRCAHAT